MTSNRILDLAQECGYKGYVFIHELEAFYNAAHADGQRDARDTDAKAWQGAATRLATNDEVNAYLKEEIERLTAKTKTAYADGQRAMRERAAKCAAYYDNGRYANLADLIGDQIALLEIE